MCSLQGLACCFGICAMSHLDDTLAQLEDFIKSDVFRKSVGIFSLFKVRWVVVVAEVGAWEDYPRLTVAAAFMWSPPMGLDSVCMGEGGLPNSFCSSSMGLLPAVAVNGSGHPGD